MDCFNCRREIEPGQEFTRPYHGTIPGLKLGLCVKCIRVCPECNAEVWTTEHKRHAQVKLVYIAHKYQGNRENLSKAKEWLLWATQFPNIIPVASWITVCEVLAETPDNRLKGMRYNAEVLSHCNEIWLCGHEISPGMYAEAAAAHKLGLKVIRVQANGERINYSVDLE